MAAQSQVRPGRVEPDPNAATKAGLSGTPATVGIIVLIAFLFLVGVRNGFKGFIPSMS